jgi:predicted dehydrogenase
VNPSAPPIRVLSAGLGNMGRSHALAYHQNPGFEIAGLVNRSKVRRCRPRLLKDIRCFCRPFRAGARTKPEPDLCSINTYSDTHADYAVMAFEAGCPRVRGKAAGDHRRRCRTRRCLCREEANDRKLVVGYILRHHPSWMRLIEEARKLGPPYVFRMNLNQQSSGLIQVATSTRR